MKLDLIYPLDKVVIAQPFGVNGEWYRANGVNVKGHNGIDFWTKHGDPVYATHDGYASYQIDANGGHGVVIITDKEFEYNGGTTFFKTVYWHLVDGLKEPKYASPFQDKTGFTKVEMGDLIGYADNTGFSTATHLHFALKPCAKGEAWGTWYNTEGDNGYSGCVDPAPYFNKHFPVTVDLMKKQIGLLQQLINLFKNLSTT